ncbi:hypothetical protein PR202_ga06366 [Eleusine coracana subsp. coracana]|uniref:Glycoside hydrolase family 3 N-terminal domain-containing protein n=1 Tax=Eleusine coracana subsp. coracana TaxID=191504 RepID=A0AAV5BX96_ELECO|nr:hypothetical protein PR202_ga06366 [Eleusine coracana subsp. coracana]
MDVPSGSVGGGSSGCRVVLTAALFALILRQLCSCGVAAAGAGEDENKYGGGARYKDPKQPLNVRIDDLHHLRVSGRNPGAPFVAGRRHVAVCAKHYVGDGVNDEGDAAASFHKLLGVHMPPYYEAVIRGVSSLMVSYSSWNGASSLTSSKTDSGSGMTTPEHSDYLVSVKRGILAGIDMVMIPFTYTEFIDDLTALVRNGTVPMNRIDDAVAASSGTGPSRRGVCMEGPDFNKSNCNRKKLIGARYYVQRDARLVVALEPESVFEEVVGDEGAVAMHLGAVPAAVGDHHE